MLKALIERMAKVLVDHPELVNVSEIHTDNTLLIQLEVASNDTGRIIGKEGRNADAMRTILAAASAHSRKRVVLDIAETEMAGAIDSRVRRSAQTDSSA